MPQFLIDWIVGFSMLCLENYTTIVVATAGVALLMAGVLILIREEVLREEDWILYLGAAFGAFFVQYVLRAISAWMRGGDYSMAQASLIDKFAQSLFSNLNSLFFLLAALSLLYWLPKERWWRTKWGLLIVLFFSSAVVGVMPIPGWDRILDAALSIISLGILSWAMFVSSGTRQRGGWRDWAARLNLIGGALYVVLHIAYAYVPKFVQWPLVGQTLAAELGKSSVSPPWQPGPATAVDAAIFGVAFGLKFILFIGALLVVMRCLSAFSPSVGREILEPVKTGRGEFLSGNGIVRAMGESIGADSAALYFRLPGSSNDLILPFRWTKGMTEALSRRPVPFDRPGRLESPLGFTLASEEIIWSRNRRTDSRFAEMKTEDGEEEMRSLVNVPLLYHGAAIGTLDFDWEKAGAFTATDMQRARHIAEFVTPVVQTERWLRAVADLRGRLQYYTFTSEEREQGTFIGRIGEQLHDVLAPFSTLVMVNFGFAPQWVISDGSRHRSSDAAGETRDLKAVDEYFRGIWGHEAVYIPTDLTLENEKIGRILLAINQGKDPIDRPSLTQDKKQMESIAALIKDTVFDLHRKRFSGIVHELHSTLDARGFASEVHWMRTVRAAVEKAGIREVAVRSRTSRIHRDEPPEITIPDDQLGPAVRYHNYLVYVWRPEDAPPQSIIELRLETSGETLFLAVAREGFGKELDPDLPWRLFVDRLAVAADSSLVRIRAIELESEAMQFEMNDLLVHELRTPAEAFRRGVEWMEESLLDDRALAPGDHKLLVLQEIKRSARKFLDLAHAVLQPVAADGRLQVSLKEVRERIDRFYEARLAALMIELRWTICPELILPVPIHLAYLVIVSLVQNSREAEAGKIHIQSEEVPDGILLHVDDNGSGIPEHIRQRVFNFGFSTKPRGSGRGVPLVQRALNRYGGDLVLGDPPKGMSTRFTIRVSKGV